MAMEWTRQLATGLEWQDAQHQELFKKTNELLVAMREAKAPAKVKDLCDFLGNYVVRHFGEEERFMQARGIASYAEHRRQHVEFTTRFTEFAAQLSAKGPSVTMALQLQTWLSGWLREHITGIDRQLAAEVRALAPR